MHLQNHWLKFPTLKTCPQRYIVAISYSNINSSTLLMTATNRLVHIKSPHKSRPLNGLNGLCPSYLNTPQQTSTSLISHSRISERMNSISRNPGWGKSECTYNKCRERCIVTGGCDDPGLGINTQDPSGDLDCLKGWFPWAFLATYINGLRVFLTKDLLVLAMAILCLAVDKPDRSKSEMQQVIVAGIVRSCCPVGHRKPTSTNEGLLDAFKQIRWTVDVS
ncbi:hypothetical protein TNCV_2556401 [Trichonephila clavipes]|nr:hypothetical protein TNCV_2556401 [Trichonephila clavipes]